MARAFYFLKCPLLVLRVQTMSTETPLDLKKTVNLPQTGFSQKANLAQSAPPRLPNWHALALYQLIRRHRAERALANKGKKKSDRSLESFRRACREHAQNALKNQTRDFKRLGILGEWDNPYLTMSNHYEAETARMFGRFVERGYVYKGAR